MNWGIKIAIVYSIFAVGMVSMVLLSTRHDVNLVTEDYYAQELDHDAHMKAIANSQSLDTPLQIRYTPAQNQINLAFPPSLTEPEGNVLLYCISDRKQDKRIVLQPINGAQAISTEGLKPGRWKVKVDWTVKGKRYFDEQGIILLSR